MTAARVAAGLLAWASPLAACGPVGPVVVAPDGAACPTDRAMRCQDATTALQCQAGHVAVVPCRGPTGCRAGDHQDAQCDDDVAIEGDRCQLTPIGESHACTPDFTRTVECKSGERFVVRSTCRGPARCNVTGRKVMCDDTIADVGDPCQPTGADDYSCSSDGKSETRCDTASATVVHSQDCRGPKACGVDHDTVRCDVTVAHEGEACRPEGLVACAEDGKVELACSPQQQWAKRRACPKRGCSVSPDGSTFVCK